MLQNHKTKNMKKLFLITATLLSFSAFAQNSQFGIKAGLVYNADNGKGVFENAGTIYEEKGEGSVGFQAGAMVRIKTGGLYIQPELLYTSFKNEYNTPTGESFEIGKRRIDFPVNLGKTFLGEFLQVQVGPVFSYYFEDDISLSDIENSERDEFNVGLQIGTGVNIKNFNVDLRYEFGFGKNSSKFVQDTWGFETENRSQLLNLSVGYFF